MFRCSRLLLVPAWLSSFLHERVGVTPYRTISTRGLIEIVSHAGVCAFYIYGAFSLGTRLVDFGTCIVW